VRGVASLAPRFTVPQCLRRRESTAAPRCAAPPFAGTLRVLLRPALMCQLRHTHHSTLLSPASAGLEHDREDFGVPSALRVLLRPRR
jgi:hypothetical protein